MLPNRLRRCYFLGAAVTALAWSFPAPKTLAAEPQIATIALLLDAGNVDDTEHCLENAVAIVFAGPATNSTVKTLSSDGFGEFAGQNLNGLSAQYVTQGGVFRGVVRGFADALPPQHGAMLFDPGSDAVIEFCGFVADNSNTLEIHPLGDLLLVIVTGTVY